MAFYFSKDKFRKNANRMYTVAIGDHVEVLDGMKCTKAEGEFLQIERYEFRGQTFYLYPVLKEWCIQSRQEKLF
ncbi:hypothetical protein P7H75_14220 [Vagococcus carniphilus]|uniref:hypothetical protein n=1 Tax=Vagococcus carniphilus TaxID=218144 RepID=UPI00288E1226|nr:hypothetical protein [Vagococcus carniphilus]MDT2816012.1 hypothetical protein [Vagococcus carniphilus]